MILRQASLFAQLLELVPRHQFDRLAQQHKVEARSKGFNSWDQFVAMLFCQVGQAHSLREITMGLQSTMGKLVHLGMKQAPKRSTLAYANEHRPQQFFQELFQVVRAQAESTLQGRKKGRCRIRSKLYSLDCSVIDLCLEVFDWAKYKRAKGAVKLHLLLDHEGYLPKFACITDGKTHEVTMAQRLSLPPNSLVVMDGGYNDYALFNKWCETPIRFVTRMRSNAVYEILESHPVKSGSNILKDEVILLTGTRAQDRCPHILRRIVVLKKNGEELVLLSNILDFAASTIANLYRQRWKIELFFKSLKQNLRVKSFIGTSANALKTQIGQH